MTRPRLLILLLALAAAALLAVGCGGDDGAGGEEGIASVIPADAPVYLEATVRPQGELRTSLEALAAKVAEAAPEAGISKDPGQQIVDEINSGLEGVDMSYEQDIEPWLGERAGIFVSGYGGSEVEEAAGVIETTDSAAAEEFVQKLAEAGGQDTQDVEHGGVTYRSDGEFGAGIVSDFLVVGDPPAINRIIDTSNGDADPLSGDGQFADALDATPAGSIGDVYVNIATFIKEVRADLDPATAQFFDAVAKDRESGFALVSLVPGADQISIDAATTAPEGFEPRDATELISSLPVDSFVAFGLPAVGAQINEAFTKLEQANIPGFDLETAKAQLAAVGVDIDSVLAAIGDVAFFVQGSDFQTLGGAIVFTSDDPQASQRLVGQLTDLATQSGQAGISRVPGGFSIRDPEELGPKPLVVLAQGDRIVMAYGEDSAEAALREGGQTLSSNADFQAAQDALGGANLSGFMTLQPLLALAESMGATADPDFQAARPVLDQIRFLVFGSGVEGGLATSKIILGLTE